MSVGTCPRERNPLRHALTQKKSPNLIIVRNRAKLNKLQLRTKKNLPLSFEVKIFFFGFYSFFVRLSFFFFEREKTSERNGKAEFHSILYFVLTVIPIKTTHPCRVLTIAIQPFEFHGQVKAVQSVLEQQNYEPRASCIRKHQLTA